MKILLTPRRYHAYGQDFLIEGINKYCALERIYTNEKKEYELPKASIELVVSHNLDIFEDSKFINELPSHIPAVGHLHCQWSFFNDRQKDNIKRALENICVCIVPADFMKNELKNYFPKIEWRVVCNGVSAERFFLSTIEQKKIFCKEHDVNSNEKLIGFIGRLDNAKGLQILERICEGLEENKWNLFIQYLSTTNNKQTREYAEIGNKLRYINPDRIRIYPDTDPFTDRPIKYFDTLLMPSLSEVNPLVVLEAFMSGVPVVGTKATQFYNELSPLGISKEYYSFTELPERFYRKNLDRANLELEKNEAEEIFLNILKILKTQQVLGDEKKSILSRQARKAGFSSENMFKKFNEIYKAAAL